MPILSWINSNPQVLVCHSCHGCPPVPPHPVNTACQNCHADTIDTPGLIDVESGAHINGTVDLEFGD